MKNNYRILALILALQLTVANMMALDGSWRGDIFLGLSKLPVVLHFTERDDTTSCTMDSPNQNAFGIPAAVDYVSADSVSVSIAPIGARFDGIMQNDEIKGHFSQKGYEFVLTLKRDLPLQQRRPQTPQEPFPYQTIDTMFLSTDGTALAGTFALPSTFERGKSLMCLLVTGSGPQNRDEELFEHRPFAVIADYLARNGVATLRYDDRGTAASKGDFVASTIHTFLEDAKSALQFAKSVSGGPIGVIGHSEGGTIALLLAQEGVPDFVVSLAGMAVSGKETVLAQNKRALEKGGFDASAIDNSMTLISEIFDTIIRQYSENDAAPIDVDAIADGLGVSVPAAIKQSLKNNIISANDYFGSLLSTDARTCMADITCPVLALNGTLDTQVDADDNLNAIEKGIKNATAVKMPGLNHLFQHAVTGDPNEYPEIRETISPEVLSLILEFIQNLN